MGLKNSNNNYVRVTNVDIQQNRVYTERWKDKATCDDPSEFDKSIPDSIQCMGLVDKLKAASKKGSIMEDIMTAGYEALKQEPPFKDDKEWADLI